MHMHVCLAAVLDPAHHARAVLVRADCAATSRRGCRSSRRSAGCCTRRRCRCTIPSGSTTSTSTSSATCTGSSSARRSRPPISTRSAHLAGAIASVPLDRSRPLWDLSIVEGLEDGLLGLVVKVHHSAMDGTAGLEILYSLFDLEPDRLRPTTRTQAETAGRARRRGSAPPDRELLSVSAQERLRTTAGIGDLVRRTGRCRHRHRPAPHRTRSGRPAARRSTAPATPFNGAIVAEPGAGVRPGRAGRREGHQGRVRRRP